MSKRRLLLFSNGAELIGLAPAVYAHDALRDFLGTGVRRVLFVPFAAVVRTEDEYLARVRNNFGPLGYEVESLHQADDPRAAVERAEAIAVGGGNTFHLLRGLYR
ncbi:MAG TPA: Type 1 glutamine amidotransferase-like domain-containing protein, partial [Pyrinomonadaceae bacterium]|nr:Type 1 glutamine amidotransferase-like domain-containing protein [Pyrinomonadaceae bacterium]